MAVNFHSNINLHLIFNAEIDKTRQRIQDAIRAKCYRKGGPINSFLLIHSNDSISLKFSKTIGIFT